MTGEVTLRGKVLAIGGLKEKVLAAYRNNITTVILPESNKKDLDELSPKVKSAITFITVKDFDEVISAAFR